MIPLHGGSLVEWINRDYFTGTNLRQIYITDSDVQSYKDLIDEINRTNDGIRYGWVTHRREMENYIPLEKIENEFQISLEDHADGWYGKDVPELLTGLCMQQIQDSNKREIVIKQRLNGSITKKMRKEDLEGIEAWEEIETWFRKIRSIVDGTYVRHVSP